MAKTANITIITPAYNEEKLISTTIRSILNQTTLPKQYIVVVNGSNDKTLQIAKSFKPQFKEKKIDFQVIDFPQAGTAFAKNRGVELATQPLLAFIDADSQARKTWIGKINQFFDEHPLAKGVTGKIIVDDAPPFYKAMTKLNWYFFIQFCYRLSLGTICLIGSNSAVKKDAFVKVGGFNESITSINGLEDIEFSPRLANLGKIHYHPLIQVETSYRRYDGWGNLFNSLFLRGKAFVSIWRKHHKF